MTELEDKDEAGELFELSPLLEDEGRESDDGRENDTLLPQTQDEIETHESILSDPIPPQSFAKVEYLDGVRGLAAVWVFMQHIMGSYTLGGHEYGFGQDGDHYNLINFPIIRLFFGNGGNAAVVIFFVLSGYVLSISSFRKLKQDKPSECRRALLSALLRRPIRLYVPPLVTSFIYAMLLHVPGPLVLPVPWDGGRPQEEGTWAEIKFFTVKSVDFFSIFRPHASNLFSYPYNNAMWTIPLELKGSLLVFGVVFVLSLGMHGQDCKVPLMAALMLFGAAVIMLQKEWKWSMVSFLFGMVLALVDTWPTGREVKKGLTPPERVREACGKLAPKKTPGWITNIRERWRIVRSIKLTPKWLSDRLPNRSSPPRPAPPKSTLFAHISFWIGMYLLSQPSHAGDRTYTTHTPGWIFLSSLIPSEYDDERYYRYWQTWASILVVYGVLRISWLQRFFSTRPLKFLGYVSFMLYLIHLPFFRILPDRVTSLFGGWPDENIKGSFWDRTWTVPNWGLYGIGVRFWLSMMISLPGSLLIAWVFTKLVDQPSVRLGKWITRVIGLDKPRPAKTPADGSMLPTGELHEIR